jgi:perosamine synthetase
MIPLSRPFIGAEEEAAVSHVLRSGQLAQGPETEAFEQGFASYLAGDGGVESVAVANGTVALQAALAGLGIGRGDEVILPSFTFIATANAVHAVGATPVFVDVEPDTFTMDPAAARAAIGPRTAALLPVHIYGHPADMRRIADLASRHGLALIEDAAQAHGARFEGRRVGTFGVGCFSFYPTKNMTTGEGGMVTTSDRTLADRLRMIRNHGMRGRYEFETFGLNLRMTDISAAIGRVQLGRLEGWNRRRRANAAWLDRHLPGVEVPRVRAGVEHVYHHYTVLSKQRDELQRRLTSAGIGCGVYYPRPVHRTPMFDTRVRLPVTERLTDEILSLPVHQGLSEQELEQITEAVAHVRT